MAQKGTCCFSFPSACIGQLTRDSSSRESNIPCTLPWAQIPQRNTKLNDIFDSYRGKPLLPFSWFLPVFQKFQEERTPIHLANITEHLLSTYYGPAIVMGRQVTTVTRASSVLLVGVLEQ